MLFLPIVNTGAETTAVGDGSRKSETINDKEHISWVGGGVYLLREVETVLAETVAIDFAIVHPHIEHHIVWVGVL